MLHGRDDERARLTALLDSARAGRAGVLVIRGDAGIGKSALLRELVQEAGAAVPGPALRVLTTAGIESELPLPFAALHRLLRPVLDLGRLPEPQARALRVAFGLQDSGGVPAEPFLVGMGTLSVLTDASDDRPVLAVVDDAHWLDAASANALLFAARQLQADPVAIVFAARPVDDGTAFHPGALPILDLHGLDPDAARRVVEQRTGQPPADAVAERLVSETGGNPLALLELPAELSREQLAGTAPLPSRLILSAQVEQAFLDRIRRARPAVQLLLLVAAADDTGRPGVVDRAVRGLGVDTSAWDEAERSGLLAVSGGRLTVRHPLVRSAVYQAATSPQRRQAHAALAQGLDDDPDRQTWHRAMAVDGPDEPVARALDEAGARAEQRGDSAAAADAYDRAAALTAAEEPRARRLFDAARNAWSAGDAARSSALCAAARRYAADDDLLRADIDRLRGRIEMNAGSAADAHRIFVLAAGRIASADPVRALELAVAATIARSHGIDSGARLEPDLLDLDLRPQDRPRTRCLKQLLVSIQHALDGDHAAALAQLHDAVESGLGGADALADLDLLGNLGNAALHLGDDETYGRLYALMLSAARADGDGMRVLYALQRLTFGHYAGGQWAALRSASEEAITLGRSVGQNAVTAAPQAWLVLLSALQGRPGYDERLAGLQRLLGTNPPMGILAQPVEDLIRWARGVRALIEGAAAPALHQFGQMQRPALTLLAAPDAIDAAVRAGDLDRAGQWVDRLAEFAAGTGLAWVHAATAFGRAITADGAGSDEAAGHFETALAHHARSGRPYDRARAELAYGEFLRRNQRRVDARAHLRAALSTFEDLQAEPWAERARQELRASGEAARRRDPSTLLDLTPMELKVAQLAGQGLSNKDVAAQCWVSPRTVAFHLRNVFAKLGISSRGQLAQLDLA